MGMSGLGGTSAACSAAKEHREHNHHVTKWKVKMRVHELIEYWQAAEMAWTVYKQEIAIVVAQ